MNSSLNKQNKEKKLISKKAKNFVKPFRQNLERQNKVYDQIKKNAQADFDFYLLTLFSGIIITLGILINSTAVVIGGMLIAPLVWPIMGLSLGFVTGRARFLKKSFFTLFNSVFLIIAVSYIFGLIVPDLVLQNNEIFGRISPTILELFIGLAAGFVGAFIIVYPKLGSAIAGVVVAAAIVPPISIIGISIARGDGASILGAALLFFSNLIAIIFGAALLFLISGFNARSEKAEETKASGFRWTVIFLLIIVIPLFLITKQTISEVKIHRVVKDVVESTWENALVSDLNVQERAGAYSILLTVKYKENVSHHQVKALENILSKRFNKDVILKVQIIPVVDAGESLLDIFTVNGPDYNLDFFDCPIVVNGKYLNRQYPKEIGCPICVEIIMCEDGREYPLKIFNQDTALCDRIQYPKNNPCVFYDETAVEALIDE